MHTELKVLSARAVKEAVSQIAMTFTQQGGCAVRFDFAPVGTLETRLASGEIADVVILSQPAMEKPAMASTLVAGSVRALGRMSIGVSIPSGAAMPDISTPEAFRALLASSRAIAVSDPAIGGTAAVYLPKLFERMGMTAALESKLRRKMGGGSDVAECVARGDADIGITFISEMAPVPGVRIVGPLPSAYGNDTTYGAAIPKTGRAQEQAEALIGMFVHPHAQAVWDEAGFTRV